MFVESVIPSNHLILCYPLLPLPSVFLASGSFPTSRFFEPGGQSIEAPILWPPDVESWLIGKDPDAGKDWRQEEKGTTEDEIAGMASSTQWTWVWANSGRQWRTRKPGVLQSLGSQGQTLLSNWTRRFLPEDHGGLDYAVFFWKTKTTPQINTVQAMLLPLTSRDNFLSTKLISPLIPAKLRKEKCFLKTLDK